ncbi:TetR/AcrR family transcriptional regulator [Streptomyces antarcticus]|uniref:TetR/AcrR family transcriptional regulator n=1 Tax=Streptomyces antarcticus TaxID=2996458 RepID=UPI00226DE30A|nr:MULTISPECIES: TetR/AcrR family transcriptional regulator [unclassified Streptomyces]MCY0941420.1 TetR/AcrR family transcriptional regulator [Streptomyces sp. H34-AA3]MCZ4085066.1 TetR/AcrR family transcriptional regulator [Streptomyces sp. H34-S5]
MTSHPAPPPGLRERKKAHTRRTIQEQALRLFLTQGYQNTTVEEIAAAAGVSHMTFFRHFPTKEAVVESDDYDPLIVRLIVERPAGEDSLAALHHALVTGLDAVYASAREALLARTRLIFETPALRARTWDNQYATQLLLTEALRSRTPAESELATRVIAAAGLAAVTSALAAWVESEGSLDLPCLVDEAFRVLRPA